MAAMGMLIKWCVSHPCRMERGGTGAFVPGRSGLGGRYIVGLIPLVRGLRWALEQNTGALRIFNAVYSTIYLLFSSSCTATPSSMSV